MLNSILKGRIGPVAGLLSALIGTQNLLAGETVVNGYISAGTSYSDGMTKGVCFREKVAASSSPGFFGNECDNYFELAVKTYLYGKSNSNLPWVTANAVASLSYNGDQSSEPIDSSDPSSSSFGFDETYVEMGNTLTDKSVLWVGRRSYRSVKISKILKVKGVGNAGNGFGVYDIPVGPGQLHLALMRNIPYKSTTDDKTNEEKTITGPSYNTFDVRYTLSYGKTSTDFIYLSQVSGEKDAYGEDDTKYESAQGNLYGITSTYTGDITNKMFIVYGDGLFGQSEGDDLNDFVGSGHTNHGSFGLTASEWNSRKKASGFQIADEVSMNLVKDKVDLGLAGVYTSVKNVAISDASSDTSNTKKVDGHNYSVGVQPTYHINKGLSMVVDLAHTVQNRDDYKSQHELNKGTIGAVIKPQIKDLDGDAELRLYATQAKWTKSIEPNDVYKNKDSGSTYGVQVVVSW